MYQIVIQADGKGKIGLTGIPDDICMALGILEAAKHLICQIKMPATKVVANEGNIIPGSQQDLNLLSSGNSGR